MFLLFIGDFIPLNKILNDASVYKHVECFEIWVKKKTKQNKTKNKNKNKNKNLKSKTNKKQKQQPQEKQQQQQQKRSFWLKRKKQQQNLCLTCFKTFKHFFILIRIDENF